MKHYIAIDFSISSTSCRDKLNPLRGTGQGNSVSDTICRDTSCLIFRYLETLKLGAMINITSENRTIQ